MLKKILRTPLFWIYCVISVMALTSSLVSSKAAEETLTDNLHRSFAAFDSSRIDTGEVFQKVSRDGRLSLHFGDKTFLLNLTPRDLRANRYHAEETDSDGSHETQSGIVRTYQGFANATADSSVRLTIDEKTFEGYIFDGKEQYFIEAAAKYSRFADQKDYILYKANDFLKREEFSCPIDLPTKLKSASAKFVPQSTDALRTVRVIEIATEADFEYVSQFGGSFNANNEILSNLNFVEGEYDRQLGLTFDVVFQHTWTTSDGYSNNGANSTLVSFQNYWNLNYSTIQRDTAHIWSAKTNASAQGIAFLNVICNSPSAAYGLTGYLSFPPTKYELTAHEIGHNLGATHVDGGTCADTIMNPILSNVTPFTFCSTSVNEVSTHVSTAGSCLAQRVIGGARFDFDGDSKADVSLFRQSNGVWYRLNSGNGSFFAAQFGQNGDKAIPADYDGDGKTDMAVYRNGIWYRYYETTSTFDAVYFGFPTDIPTPGDFDGDGKADVVVFRPSNGVWYRLNSSNGAFSAIQFGLNGDIPVANDYDGDGKADISVFRPSSGVWYRLNSIDGSFYAVQFGQNGDKPIPADYDGDGKTDIAVYRNGSWYRYFSATLNFDGIPFGFPTDIPTPGDFDGDGKADVSVFRPSDGNWYRLSSINYAFSVIRFGTNGDLPAEASFIQ